MSTSDIGDFFDQVSRLTSDKPINYREIKEALDPCNIIKPGQPGTWNSVEYFHRAWGGQLREYETEFNTPIYDVEDWLVLLCGSKHAAFYMRKFSAPNGYFMTGMADDLFLWWDFTGDKIEWNDKRRWVGDIPGLRGIAMELGRERHRKDMDYTRINIHVNYMVNITVLVTDMKYNQPLREAVEAFINGQQLDIWEDAVNELPLDEK